MSRYHSYINSAKDILARYGGAEPFATFLKKYFAANKKYGSADRKQVGNLCYCFFRLGKLKNEWPVEERILLGLYLSSGESAEMLRQFRPDWDAQVSLQPIEKISRLHAMDQIESIFPIKEELSGEIDKTAFILSHLRQPDVFLRLRPGNEKIVGQKLETAGIPFRVINPSCLALAPSSKVEQLIQLNKEAVVQDLNSQNTVKLLEDAATGILHGRPRAWDCCAGSGGKSIMLYDLAPRIDLTVSDVRESILVNLEKRFKEAGIRKYKKMIIDLARSSPGTQLAPFDLIIADVPCSGSGTWARTPEQLSYFKEAKVGEYESVQGKILGNVRSYLKPGGFLLYSTCSVFKRENESRVEYLRSEFRFELLGMQLLPGYDRKADTLFAALLRKPL